jgi:hypothetical protein
VVAIAIAASGTPTKVSSNMRVSMSVKKIKNKKKITSMVAKLLSYRY